MTTLTTVQASFAAGEIDPRLIGRTDLKAYAEGASLLSNAWVTVAGGVRRRDGMRHVATVPHSGRLAAVAAEDGTVRLFVLADGVVQVFEDGVLVATTAAPWTGAHLPNLAWSAHRGGLLVCHTQLPPQQVLLDPQGSWRVLGWIFETAAGIDASRPVRLQPYAKYAPPEARLEAVQDADGRWTFRSNQRVFDPGHVGTRLRFRGIEIEVRSVTADRTTIAGDPLAALGDPSPTFEWEEQAFSPVAGYPAACLVFRERLVAGGVPAMANRLWMSKIGRPFDFDTGQGLDDEAISFGLGDDPSHAIRAFSAGRELEVFTTASEWTIDGNPLAPASTVALRQTGIGSFAERHVTPTDVDGASVFLGRGGDSLIEYVFTNIDTAYQAQDLAVRARHVLVSPVDLAFDAKRRLLIVVNGDGTLAMATLDRNAQMVAWSRHETAGRVLAAVSISAQVYLLVDRDGVARLECLDDALLSDAGVVLTSPTPTTDWSGLDHLEGLEVAVVGDGLDLGSALVTGGAITTAEPVSEVRVGLAYSHRVEPLPLVIKGRAAEVYRPLEVAFQLHATMALVADVGEGARAIDLGEALDFSGIKRVRARGWRRGSTAPLWRIESDRPLPFQLLSTTSDVKVTR